MPSTRSILTCQNVAEGFYAPVGCGECEDCQKPLPPLPDEAYATNAVALPGFCEACGHPITSHDEDGICIHVVKRERMAPSNWPWCKDGDENLVVVTLCPCYGWEMPA